MSFAGGRLAALGPPIWKEVKPMPIDKQLAYKSIYMALVRMQDLKEDIQSDEVLSESLDRTGTGYDYYLLSIDALEQAIRFLNLGGKSI